MKKINIMFIIIFFIILLIPVVLFDFRDNVVSEIDNRKLTENPFDKEEVLSGEVSLTNALDNYIDDRIGLRNFFIRSYTKLNDKLFNVLVHPSYEYGEDKYVFFESTGDKLDDDQFYDLFVNMLVKINKYCKERNVPFYFVFEPSKSSIISDKVNNGINYNNEWINDYLKEISSKGITVVDNYSLLKEKYENGEMVFNKQYDAGHWNYLGAFYGVNNILNSMKNDFSKIHINEETDFDVKNVTYTSLLVSEFPIEETVKEYNLKENVKDLYALYRNDLIIDKQHRNFHYYYNEKQNYNAPKTMVFQGSYMNGYGYKFLQNALSTYISIHNYENILNFDYYYNLFKPQAVIFEVTEYALYGSYFNRNKLNAFELNPIIEDFNDYKKEYNNLKNVDINLEITKEYSDCISLIVKNYCIEKNNNTIDIVVSNVENDNISFGYVEVGNNIYDLKKDDSESTKYSVTISKDNYQKNIKIVLIDELNKIEYVYK